MVRERGGPRTGVVDVGAGGEVGEERGGGVGVVVAVAEFGAAGPAVLDRGRVQRAEDVGEAVPVGQGRVEGGLERRELPWVRGYVPGFEDVEVTQKKNRGAV